jgi:hypothetical protein
MSSSLSINNSDLEEDEREQIKHAKATTILYKLTATEGNMQFETSNDNIG